ncbi:MAG: hypothetical protein ACJAT1_002020 [Marivirga sp.]|jgi:hypothetical protein
MKVIWRYFVSYHKDVSHPIGLYLSITLFLAALTTFNYTFKLERWLDKLNPDFMPYLGHFVMFSFIYAFIVWLCLRFKVIDNVFRDKAFILKSILMLLILTIDVCFKIHQDIIKEVFSTSNRFYMYRVIGQFTSIITVIVPLIVYYKWKEKHDQSLYGLKASARKVGQYLPLILLMAPLIAIASFEESFRHFYPIFRTYNLFFDWSVEARALLFELAYGFDFMTTEFLFRGFMVLGFTHFLGPRAVLPMVGLYVALHFGKPAGETIGSFFGGYILGVLAYKSKNIWGGIIAHMGIAWLMELFAYLQKTYNP